MKSIPEAPQNTSPFGPDRTAGLAQAEHHQNNRKKFDKPLLVADLKKMDGLTNLAREHCDSFIKQQQHPRLRQYFGSGDGASIAPMFNIRIGTACTGSAQDLVVMTCMKRALEASFPDSKFSFEYLFNCEKNAAKRSWISFLHETLAAPGQADPCMPCMFEDITELKNGQCKCHTHSTSKQPKECRIPIVDVLCCSTSCKKYSKMNQNKSTPDLWDDDQTGESTKTLRALCELMESIRPDLLFFENVEDIQDENPDGDSVLKQFEKALQDAGYEVQVAFCKPP